MEEDGFGIIGEEFDFEGLFFGDDGPIDEIEEALIDVDEFFIFYDLPFIDKEILFLLGGDFF